MSRTKHLLSYLYPVLIEAREGELSKYLEVRKSYGNFVLDSQTVNYSYGGLKQLFESLFRKTRIKDQNFNKVLLLGMGAGCVVSLLLEKYKKGCDITAIEDDGVVIELAKKYFNIQRFEALHILKQDAYKFIDETENKFDFIIVDLFIDSEVPEKFETPLFIKNLKRIASSNCVVIFNKTTETNLHRKEFKELFREFDYYFPGSTVIKLFANGMENSFIYYNALADTEKKEDIKARWFWERTMTGIEPAV